MTERALPHSPAGELRVECPPKVNLYLRIVRRREDGFHELETLFQSVSGGDTLTGHALDRLSFRCDAPGIPLDERNLVVRAAHLLRDEAVGRKKAGAGLALVKRTPMGAGMGGGSVDAAAALVLLNTLWELGLSRERLAELAAQLGSDVPFFLHGGTAVGGGRGEELTGVRTAPLWLVLVRPEVSVNTGWAYGRWRPELCGGPELPEFVAALERGEPREIAGLLRNDLEPGVAAEVPEIAAAREWLLARGALGARMTGSGSVVFGIAQDPEHARRIAAAGGAPGRAWVVRCLSREEAELRVEAAP